MKRLISSSIAIALILTLASCGGGDSDSTSEEVVVTTPNTETDTNGTETPICAQVIAYAINPTTQECQEFATPCDVPTGWIACQQETTPLVAALPTPPAPPSL